MKTLSPLNARREFSPRKHERTKTQKRVDFAFSHFRAFAIQPERGWSLIVLRAFVYSWFILGLVHGQTAASRPGQSVAQMLGFRADEKLLIIHGDDAGMCHSVNAATIEAMTKGEVNSASLMVPCPWFPEMAAYCREHADMDFGLHLTLTSEWRYYRWRSVTPYDQVPGLIDPEGFLWRSVEDAASHGSAAEVEKELRAQVERALAFGMKPTHVDTHMGTVFARADFFRAYCKVAREFKLPYLLPRWAPDRLQSLGEGTKKLVANLEKENVPQQEYTLDDLIMLGRDMSAAEQKQFYLDALRSLRPGITQIIIHCGIDDAELQACTYSHARRGLDREIFEDPAIKGLLASLHIRPITWKQIGELQSRAASK